MSGDAEDERLVLPMDATAWGRLLEGHGRQWRPCPVPGNIEILGADEQWHQVMLTTQMISRYLGPLPEPTFDKPDGK